MPFSTAIINLIKKHAIEHNFTNITDPRFELQAIGTDDYKKIVINLFSAKEIYITVTIDLSNENVSTKISSNNVEEDTMNEVMITIKALKADFLLISKNLL